MEAFSSKNILKKDLEQWDLDHFFSLDLNK